VKGLALSLLRDSPVSSSPAVPHDDHFLQRLDRITREQTEFALSLYRDHEALAWLLERVSLPPEATRVALAIGKAGDGPFVVVTRDGHFVTCLGAGMSPGPHPVIARGQIDAQLAKLADHRGRLQVARRELRPGETEDDDVLTRVSLRGERMSREDFVAVSAFEPLMGTGFWRYLIDSLRTITTHRGQIARRAGFGARDAKGLRAYHNLEWTVAHLMLLCSMGDRATMEPFLKTTPLVSLLCAVQRGHTFSLRAAWAAARFGKTTLAAYKQSLATGVSQLEMLDAALCIGAIALRHSGATAEASKILARHANGSRADATGEGREDPGAGFRAAYSTAVLAAIEHPEQHVEVALAVGKNLVFQRAARLEGFEPRIEREEDVPEDLARTALLSFDGDVLDAQAVAVAASSLTVAARAAPEDFYWPRALVRPMLGDYDVQQTIDRLERHRDWGRSAGPTRKAVDVGRNDPCPCGSGKKFKKCCG
jgi:hypothetical protein